ncbi:cyclic GMP-AMP synthase DncV-like nucleotidyltransferase [Carboxylicivirga sp. M1479]|uniref:CBASS cGAMP synthase n=1 Tax=Carboxylicivirga sp. M1479 TaxID=2594476 RepID=UPI00117872DA|nr:hypothetical protein [Carboxylicivirga sp. M1479]TRX65807.1 hypothetical protein FNN09_17040 [Carboxylicivirga sp. M1479]
MSNCHNLFQTFNSDLNISKSKKKKLMTSRDNLRDLIRKYFKENHSEYTPYFAGQGSYSLGTMIRTKDDTCDLDNGVYFFPKPTETGTTLQKWVKEAVKEAASTTPEHRKRCVRVNYVAEYHIDLPIYYKTGKDNEEEHPHLAVKKEDWSESDPREFNRWFKDIKDDKGQLVRIVRYLKAWGDTRSFKMPSGITMTVLAANNISYNDRDDISLKETLDNIQSTLNSSWTCVIPTTPGDDLLANFKGDKDKFLDASEKFIDDATKAIAEANQLNASKKWIKHLGSYFPEGENKDVDKQMKKLFSTATSVVTGNAKLNSLGHIQSNEGVDHKPHKNYGG